MGKYTTVESYIADFDGKPRQRLEEVRKLVKQILPDAEERISYSIPAYFVDKKLIIYFAGFKSHIGMYPGRTSSSAYNQLAAKYAHGKSTARFPHDEPLPKDIIKKFIDARLQETNREN
ncbi:MAG: iron chaperone [Acidobacteriota bacterium]